MPQYDAYDDPRPVMPPSKPITDHTLQQSPLSNLPVNKPLITCHAEGINKASDIDTLELDQTSSPTSNATASIVFAPATTRLDAASRPNSPFWRPDTPHPRLSRAKVNTWPASQQTSSLVLQPNNQSVTYAESYHSDHRREDFKHMMFLEWLDRHGTN